MLVGAVQVTSRLSKVPVFPDTVGAPGAVGGSPSSVTLISTPSRTPVDVPFDACTVTRYTLSPSASAGFSWSGGVVKVSSPELLMEKSFLSSPNSRQETLLFPVLVTPNMLLRWSCRSRRSRLMCFRTPQVECPGHPRLHERTSSLHCSHRLSDAIPRPMHPESHCRHPRQLSRFGYHSNPP